MFSSYTFNTSHGSWDATDTATPASNPCGTCADTMLFKENKIEGTDWADQCLLRKVLQTVTGLPHDPLDRCPVPDLKTAQRVMESVKAGRGNEWCPCSFYGAY